MNKKGIAVAGNMIVDILYPIHGIPKPGELTTITEGVSKSIGGCLCNDIVDLAKLDPQMKLVALGRTGDDESGAFLMEQLRQHKNIDMQYVKVTGTTSFTLVMADDITKQRTFYHCRGGNAGFCEEDIPWDELDVDMLHIGYILLLDTLDEDDQQYGTKMAKLLARAQAKGIKTSIDVVSEASDRFRKKVCPALRYTDYCVINEVEASASTGVPLRTEDGELIKENMPAALKKMKELGVSTWAVIHCPEVGYGLDENDNLVEVPSLKLPEGWIAGTVGAGDAFCSGVLYGAWKGMDLKSAIELGTASAVCSLSCPSATDGMRSVEEAMKIYNDLR
ncbi:MAG: carbohydrate kinase family protein [Oscillospiraceae bacterium]|nr:carbohydrate kinase family protein [Oscillospiraceae bacterium]